MKVTKQIITNDETLPFIASIPYKIEIEEKEFNSFFEYNPETQISITSSGDSYSTYDDSIGGWALSSKSDTKKDD